MKQSEEVAQTELSSSLLAHLRSERQLTVHLQQEQLPENETLSSSNKQREKAILNFLCK